MKAEETQLRFTKYISYFYMCTCDGTGCPVTTARCASYSATEDVSSSPIRGKGGDKGQPGTAARKRRGRGGEDLSKTKRAKQSRGVQGTTKRKRGKVTESSYGGENPAPSGQSTTSSKLGEGQCRGHVLLCVCVGGEGEGCERD